ncbi:MAG TPA: hypothetical protein VFU85_09675 [Nocardioides sp.]|nr:hypothetical protein [Nocardioides sp.]
MDPSSIYGIRWVHVFEEDTPEGHVYKPDSGPVPLSRRPREALTLNADGSATVEVGGADDRPSARRAAWRSSPEALVVELSSATGKSTELHIVRVSPDRLVVASSRG